MLTSRQVEHTKPGSKPVRLYDGRGLYLEISPAGGRGWRFRYFFARRERRMSLGPYPEVSLKEAREKREELRDVKARFLIAEKRSKVKAIRNRRKREAEARWEHRKASLRAKVEHPFRVIKQQFGYAKVRYRGLQKNTARLTMLFALGNLWMARKRIMELQG